MNPKADWGRAATSKNVLTAVPLNKWAIIYVERNETVVRNFCKIMQQQGPRMGIPIANPKPIKIANDRTESYLKELRSIINTEQQSQCRISHPASGSVHHTNASRKCSIPTFGHIFCDIIMICAMYNEDQEKARERAGHSNHSERGRG